MEPITLVVILVSAFLYAGLGYKFLAPKGEEFDWTKAARTLIIAVVICLVAVWKNISFQDADIVVQAILASSPIVFNIVLDRLSVALGKWLKAHISSSPKLEPEAPKEPPKPE